VGMFHPYLVSLSKFFSAFIVRTYFDTRKTTSLGILECPVLCKLYSEEYFFELISEIIIVKLSNSCNATLSSFSFHTSQSLPEL
jgi:hypothetical protein